MTDTKQRKQIKASLKFFGGVRSVSSKAHISAGNLSRWLKGEPTLSDEKLAVLLHLIGLPSYEPDQSCVHTWKLRNIPEDIVEALQLYFSGPLTICELSVAEPALAEYEYATQSIHITNSFDEMYLLTDGKVRAVLDLNPQIFKISETLFKSSASWDSKVPSFKTKLIEADEYKSWHNGIPDVRQFDHAIYESTFDVSNTLAAVIEAIEEEGVSYAEAAAAIRRIRKKPS